ncbi:MAG: hypothetical protein JWP57_4192 [Spirosoma sp.]|nr:hypothetical protein [Spirosoma sp.]
MEGNDNPMSAANSAPRCTAKSKRTAERCNGPAVTGWQVCRFHGAGGGHPVGKAHPSWKHGMRSRELLEMRRLVAQLGRETREIERMI